MSCVSSCLKFYNPKVKILFYICKISLKIIYFYACFIDEKTMIFLTKLCVFFLFKYSLFYMFLFFKYL